MALGSAPAFALQHARRAPLARGRGARRGAGDPLVPSSLTLVSMWGVRITLATLLAPRMGLAGVWLAMCLELCARGILFLIRLLRGRWLEKNV